MKGADVSWRRRLIGLSSGWWLAVSLIMPLAASAASSPGPLALSTSPLPINLTAQPGTMTTAVLRVKNDGPQTEHLKVSLLKFGANGLTGQPLLEDRGPDDSYFDWVSFAPASFDAPPGQWLNVTMMIKVPATAAFGYYFAAVFSRAGSLNPSGSEAVVSGSTATLVLLDVPSPNTKRQLEAVSFTADHRFYEFLPTSFGVKLHNSGNIHLAPTGNIFISRGKATVAALDVNAVKGNILPGTNRVFTASWSDGFPVYVPKTQDGRPVLKNGQPTTRLQWDFTQLPKLRFGHYTAKLTMIYNDGTRDVPLTGQVSFWVIPWRLLIGWVVVILLAVVGLQSTVRKVWRTLTRRRG